jgi:hypothetical protein
MMTPKFKPGDRVMFTQVAGEILWCLEGTVAGYSSLFPPMHIVILDEPLTHPNYFGWRAVCCDGSMLDPAAPEIRGQPKDVAVLDDARDPSEPSLTGKFFAFAYHKEFKLKYVAVSGSENVLNTGGIDTVMHRLGFTRAMENTFEYGSMTVAEARRWLTTAGAIESKTLRDFLKGRG